MKIHIDSNDNSTRTVTLTSGAQVALHLGKGSIAAYDLTEAMGLGWKVIGIRMTRPPAGFPDTCNYRMHDQTFISIEAGVAFIPPHHAAWALSNGWTEVIDSPASAAA